MTLSRAHAVEDSILYCTTTFPFKTACQGLHHTNHALLVFSTYRQPNTLQRSAYDEQIRAWLMLLIDADAVVRIKKMFFYFLITL